MKIHKPLGCGACGASFQAESEFIAHNCSHAKNGSEEAMTSKEAEMREALEQLIIDMRAVGKMMPSEGRSELNRLDKVCEDYANRATAALSQHCELCGGSGELLDAHGDRYEDCPCGAGTAPGQPEPQIGISGHYPADNGYCSCRALCETGTGFKKHIEEMLRGRCDG